MQVRTPRIKTSFSIVILWCIALFTSCSEDMPIDHPNGDLSGERISFGVSKDASSWEPDSRALQQTDFLTLPCISDDETFGVSLVVKEKAVPLSRGTQFTSADTLKAFDVAAYYYEESNSYTELFFNEKVNDGVHTSGKTYYWPREGKMDFMAFAPQDALSLPTVETYNGSTINIPYTITTEEQNHKDIIVATSIGLNNKESGLPVSLNFKHLLASVRFKVGEMQFIKINSLTLSGVYGGDVTFIYNKNTNTWTNSVPTTIKTYNPDFVDTSGLPQGSEIAGNVNNATLFMIPQELPDDAVIEVTYTELLTGKEGHGYANIGEGKWEAGKDYAYTFNIGNKFDVTIPTPKDQDAHYIMLPMEYKLGDLSDKVQKVRTTASWIDGKEGNSTVNGISLKFEEDLTELQRSGCWTDALYEKTIQEGNEDSDAIIPIKNTEKDRFGNEGLRGGSYVDIFDLKNSGEIVLFIEENNGDVDREGELILTATLNDNETEIVIGRGRFKQLCPCWNSEGVGVERFESSNQYQYGFSYNRYLKYVNQNSSLFEGFGGAIIAWLFGSYYGEGVEADGSFIRFETAKAGVFIKTDYIKYIHVSYAALNDIYEKASSPFGINNTDSLYSSTGKQDFTSIEEAIVNMGFTLEDFSGSNETPSDYAAFVAITRNKMYELKTTVDTDNGDKIVRRPYLYKDADGEHLIEWYLPSSAEAQLLKETGTSAQGISPLNGEYWSSTAGDDINAWSHSYTFNNNTFGSINESQPRMDELKVRAVRKKP